MQEQRRLRAEMVREQEQLEQLREQQGIGQGQRQAWSATPPPPAAAGADVSPVPRMQELRPSSR